MSHVCVCLSALLITVSLWAQPTASHVVLITTDGLRWNEVFEGADAGMMNKAYGNVSDTNALNTRFWRPTPQTRREALFPFLWKTVAREGQLWGNRTLNSDVRVSNTRNFSYPGYNEFLTGIADPRIDSNDKKLNPNTNVLEWLQGRSGFHDRVAAVVNWDVLPWVLNTPRSQIPVWSGFEVPPGTRRLAVPEALTEMVDHGRTIWPGVLLDTFVGYAARHTVREFKPRALFVSYGETDDWAHEGHYERYLNAAHEFDRFLSGLWNLCQSMPEYRAKTSFLITVDHGRGPAPLAWKSHGREIADSAYMWFAAIGPHIPAAGERRETPLVTQSQIAATVAALVAEPFHQNNPKTAPPIRELFAPQR